MIKKFFIMLSILLVSGCSANVKIKLDDAAIEQAISFDMKKEEMTSSTIYETIADELLKVEHDSEILGNFDSEDINAVAPNTYNASIKMNLNDYNVDFLMNLCYDSYSITQKENVLTIKTGNFNCFNKYDMMDKVTIELISDYEVLSNNADEKTITNEYIWKMDKENPKPIQIEINLEKIDNTKTIFFWIVIGIICVIIFIVSLSIYGKILKNNEI